MTMDLSPAVAAALPPIEALVKKCLEKSPERVHCAAAPPAIGETR